MEKGTFADRLKIAMDREHKKQVDVIRAALEQGVKLGKSHMSQYVGGKTVPRPDILQFLAETLHVDADWLSGQEGEASRQEQTGQSLPSEAEEEIAALAGQWDAFRRESDPGLDLNREELENVKKNSVTAKGNGCAGGC